MKFLGSMSRMVWMVALLVAGSSVWLSAAAQQPVQKRVVVAIADTMPPFHSPEGQSVKGVATIVRFASDGKSDIIVLDSANATLETLATAINTLRSLRASDPSPVHDRVALISTFTPPVLDPRVRSVLTARLRELQTQPHTLTGIVGPGIGKLGHGKRIELTDAEINP